MSGSLSGRYYRPLLDFDDSDDKNDDDDNGSTVEVKSTVCQIPSMIDTSCEGANNQNRTSVVSVHSSKSRRGTGSGSSSYVRTYDVKIDHLYDLILALETVRYS